MSTIEEMFSEIYEQERMAKETYEKILRKTDDAYIQEKLKSIIIDEERHMRNAEEALKILRE